MSWLPDRVLGHLREVANLPDLSGTRYRLVEPIGQGGMGAVYLTEDEELGRRVALKVLHLEDASGDAVARMLREARTLARLEHPSIVPLYDAGRLADGRVFYTMKHVAGERLDQYRARQSSVPDLLRVFIRAAEAVAYAHSRGIIHRDLKPENIMVGAFGEVQVMDWGVARWLAQSDDPGAVSAPAGPDLTAHGAVVGTPAYMAPEQAAGRTSEVDERSDIYALGGILRFLLTGQVPGAARQQDGAVARPLRSIWARAMSPEPAKRYGSAAEMAADVACYLDGEPVSAHRENLLERAARLSSRNKTLLLLLAAYVTVRVALLLVSMSR